MPLYARRKTKYSSIVFNEISKTLRPEVKIWLYTPSFNIQFSMLAKTIILINTTKTSIYAFDIIEINLSVYKIHRSYN